MCPPLMTYTKGYDGFDLTEVHARVGISEVTPKLAAGRMYSEVDAVVVIPRAMKGLRCRAGCQCRGPREDKGPQMRREHLEADARKYDNVRATCLYIPPLDICPPRGQFDGQMYCQGRSHDSASAGCSEYTLKKHCSRVVGAFGCGTQAPKQE